MNGRRVVKIIVAVAIPLALVSACLYGIMSHGGVPVRFVYRYVSLEDVPGIRVEKRGKLDFEKAQDHAEMPFEYTLDRERYRLSFSRVFDGRSDMEIRASGDGQDSLGLLPRSDRTQFSERPCDRLFVRQGALHFSWTCELAYKYQWFISFDVTDSAGQVIGEENIPFTIVRNGHWWETDSL